MNEYERHIGGSGNGDPQARGRSPDEIEREIEATRERMGRDIDELGERLSPGNLKRQAKEAITGKAQDIAHNMGESARYTGFRMMDFIQENTSLVAAMGLGAVWLIQQRNKSEISGDRMARFAYTGPERRREGFVGKITDRASQVGHTVSESVSSAASAVGERASDLGAQAGEVTERARERVSELGAGVRQRARDLRYTARYRGMQARGGLVQLVEENPLAVAAGVAVLGLACGLLVPESQREQRLMGPARDDLVHRAQETARRVKDAAVEAGQELRESVREEVSERAPEVKAVVQETVQAVGEQVKEKAGRVKEEAKQAVKEQRPGRGAAPA
jgi:gas vesicle protein